MPANKNPCPHPIPGMCEKDPPGPMAEPTAQKLGRLGVAMVGWGSAKNMVPGFSLQATMVRGDVVVGLGCKGGFGDPISMVKNPLVSSTSVTTPMDPLELAHLSTGKIRGWGLT